MEITNKPKQNFVLLVLFLATLMVALISLVSVVFPAFLISTFGGLEDHLGVNPFEIGMWAWPFIATQIIVFSLIILYFKNRLNQPVTRAIKFIFNFEISSSVAFFVLTILLGFYIFFTVGELTNGQFETDFDLRGKSNLENYSIETIGDVGLGKHVSLFLTSSSMKLFENYKVIPFIVSIALLILTYFFTLQITNKRFAGIVSMIIVLQSNIFLMYDTTVAYPNYWIMFYLLSLLLIYKKGYLSSLTFAIGVLSKSFTMIFLPITIFFIFESKLPKKRKKIILILYGITVILLVVGFILISPSQDQKVPLSDFDSHDFWVGLTSISNSLRLDGLVMLFLLPLIVGLFLASKKGVIHTESIMLLILIMLLSAPILQAFSDHQNVPYRFVPLIVFFAIGVGLLLSKKETKLSE